MPRGKGSGSIAVKFYRSTNICDACSSPPRPWDLLDVNGYVSETNATNLFMVDHNSVLLTPPAGHCLPGITRATVLELAREANLPVEIRRLSLPEFHSADEVITNRNNEWFDTSDEH